MFIYVLVLELGVLLVFVLVFPIMILSLSVFYFIPKQKKKTYKANGHLDDVHKADGNSNNIFVYAHTS